ncbi:MAG: terminase TerL endonuclease subunit [Ahrensia sp.]|nr:terminase TerL endonuclease subunit [Ahrensia sp.]
MPHVKGVWASKGELLVLSSWQIFLVACLFGWKRKKDDTRRFRRLFLLVPRKNGKSILAAGIGLYMLVADREFGAEVYSGATSEKQAWEVFRPARLMAQKRSDMCQHYGIHVGAKNVHIISNQSRFEPLIGKPGDGASPSCAIVDEYHEHDSDHMFSTMETGMGARTQPLMIVITTAGDNIAGPCYSMQKEAQSMLEGIRPDDETLALIYTIDEDDDWTDADTLRKANPNFGVSVLEDFLLARQRDAMTSPRKAGAFRTKHLNEWVQSRSAYFNVLQYIKAGNENLSIEQFQGQECIMGVDLAEKKDLTAIEILFKHKDGYARFGRYYAPEETIEAPENDHLRLWRDTGELIQTDGAVTDQREIQNDIMDLMDRFNVREIAFDPWHSRQIAVELSEAGANCIEFRNSPSHMNEPMRAMDALIADGGLHHNGGAAFSWMLSNVIDKSRDGELHRPGKERADNKIDGPVACMMALGRWLMDEKTEPSVYQTRGVLIL